MKLPTLLLACALIHGCAAVPIGFTIGYQDINVGVTWMPQKSGGKNPIYSK